MRQTRSVMAVAFFALFLKRIDAMVLQITPKRMKLLSCACAQIKAHEELNGWLYPDDARYPPEKGKRSKPEQGWWWPFFFFFLKQLPSFEWIELRSCACTQIEALEKGNRWLY